MREIDVEMALAHCKEECVRCGERVWVSNMRKIILETFHGDFMV